MVPQVWSKTRCIISTPPPYGASSCCLLEPHGCSLEGVVTLAPQTILTYCVPWPFGQLPSLLRGCYDPWDFGQDESCYLLGTHGCSSRVERSLGIVTCLWMIMGPIAHHNPLADRLLSSGCVDPWDFSPFRAMQPSKRLGTIARYYDWGCFPSLLTIVCLGHVFSCEMPLPFDGCHPCTMLWLRMFPLPSDGCRSLLCDAT